MLTVHVSRIKLAFIAAPNHRWRAKSLIATAHRIRESPLRILDDRGEAMPLLLSRLTGSTDWRCSWLGLAVLVLQG
jgi:hypothetical protein